MMRLYYLLSFLLIASQLHSQTTITLKPNAALGKDAGVWDFTPTTNRGSTQSINIYTWTRQSATTVKRAYLEFDLSSIPSNATIVSARLNLFYDPITNEGFTNHSGITDFEIRRVTTPWLENTITWASQPSVTNVNMVDVPGHSFNNQNFYIPVDTLLSDMIQNGNHGFQLRMKNETNPLRGLLIASSDHPNANLHPELVVTYTTTNIPKIFAAKDAMIWSGNSTANYGSHPNLVSYTFQGSGPLSFKRIFMEFDISSIPAGANLDSAYLKLFFNASSSEGFPVHTGVTDLEINPATAPWIESTINWNNQPAVDTSVTINVPPHQSPTQDYRIDVTSLVDTLRRSSNNGFRIKMKNEQSAFRGVMFPSSDNPNPALHPYLETYWSLPTAIEESAEAENRFDIYPNPSEGLINLSVSDLSSIEQMQIYDSRGKLMSSFNMPRSNSLDLSEMAKGLYFIRVQFESGEIVSKKFILE